MRNKVDFISDPSVLFLNPWVEEGLKLLATPDFIWRETEAAVIDGFAVSAHEEINAKIRSVVSVTKKQKRFQTAIEINTVPAVIEGASFRKSHVMARGKLVLSGASSARLLNSFRWENEESIEEPNITLNRYFSRCREANIGRRIAVESTFVEPDLDFAIECRNTFNYFHFLTETLCQLCVLDDLGFRGNIYFHFPNQEDKQRDFVDRFVASLFPEYAGRVFFERAPKDYDLILTSFDMIGAICQMAETNVQGLKYLVPDGQDPARVETQPILAMNAVSSAQLRLRARALKAIEGGDYSYLPKRFFVGRSAEHSRHRPLGGQDVLVDNLAKLGFEFVIFEDLDPLEQIAICAQAEVMVSHHGAGFANMIFASPGAYFIELGTLQTAQYRWADFWPIAHAAQCRYITFFADFNSDDPLCEPQFATDGIMPTAVSTTAVQDITTFVAAVLGYGPTVADSASLATLGRRVLRAGNAGYAIELLENHKELLTGDLPLCLLRADCHKALGETKSELVALDDAYKADPSRWQTLIRMIWCANRCGRTQVIRWALSRLSKDFPDRHDAFVSNHDWVRFVA